MLENFNQPNEPIVENEVENALVSQWEKDSQIAEIIKKKRKKIKHLKKRSKRQDI